MVTSSILESQKTIFHWLTYSLIIELRLKWGLGFRVIKQFWAASSIFFNITDENWSSFFCPTEHAGHH